MATPELPGHNRTNSPGRTEKWIAIYIAVLAVLLSICTMLGNAASGKAAMGNVDSVNLWSWFQGKNARKMITLVAADELEIRLSQKEGLSAETQALMREKLDFYEATIKRLQSDPEDNDGLEQLYTRAKESEAVRDKAIQQRPYFAYGQAFLQIAIVLGSVAIISNTRFFLSISGVFGFAGTLFSTNGQHLLVLFL